MEVLPEKPYENGLNEKLIVLCHGVREVRGEPRYWQRKIYFTKDAPVEPGNWSRGDGEEEKLKYSIASQRYS